MADPALVLLVVLGAAPGERPRAGLVVGALTEALGGEARVLVEDRASEPSDAEAVRMLDRVHASALAEIAWSHPAHARAHVRVYIASHRTFYDRDLSFEPTDAAED